MSRRRTTGDHSRLQGLRPGLDGQWPRASMAMSGIGAAAWTMLAEMRGREMRQFRYWTLRVERCEMEKVREPGERGRMAFKYSNHSGTS